MCMNIQFKGADTFKRWSKHKQTGIEHTDRNRHKQTTLNIRIELSLCVKVHLLLLRLFFFFLVERLNFLPWNTWIICEKFSSDELFTLLWRVLQTKRSFKWHPSKNRKLSSSCGVQWIESTWLTFCSHLFSLSRNLLLIFANFQFCLSKKIRFLKWKTSFLSFGTQQRYYIHLHCVKGFFFK